MGYNNPYYYFHTNFKICIFDQSFSHKLSQINSVIWGRKICWCIFAYIEYKKNFRNFTRLFEEEKNFQLREESMNTF
jgi:hypothetical protein